MGWFILGLLIGQNQSNNPTVINISAEEILIGFFAIILYFIVSYLAESRIQAKMDLNGKGDFIRLSQIKNGNKIVFPHSPKKVYTVVAPPEFTEGNYKYKVSGEDGTVRVFKFGVMESQIMIPVKRLAV